MIRQFEIQLGEFQQMLHVNVVTQHQLMKENEALKEEIKNLKKIYWKISVDSTRRSLQKRFVATI